MNAARLCRKLGDAGTLEKLPWFGIMTPGRTRKPEMPP